MKKLNLKNFNLNTLFLIVYFFLAIIVLFVIWYPKSAKTSEGKLEYEKIEDGENKCLDIYLNEISYYLSVDNFNELVGKVDKTFMQNNNLNESNLKDYLIQNNMIGENPIIKSSTFSKQGDNVYVYRIKYTINGIHRIVNITESFPYQYVISFEQDSLPIIDNSNDESSNNGVNRTITSNDVEYEVTKEKVKENGITYSIKITNHSDKNVELSFDNISNVYVIMEDESRINIGGAVISSSDENTLTPNSSLKKDLYFSIPSSEQYNINSINIKNIKIGDEIKSISINIKNM